jgi:hypothetical protein
MQEGDMHRKAAVLAAVVALAAGGCGGDSDDSEPAAATTGKQSTRAQLDAQLAEASDKSELTKAELVRYADAVCDQLGRDTVAALEAGGRSVEKDRLTEAEAASRIVPRVVTHRRQAADDLEGLKPPENLSASYERYIAGLRQSAELLPSIADPQGGNGELAQVERARSRVAKSIGFKRCT